MVRQTSVQGLNLARGRIARGVSQATGGALLRIVVPLDGKRVRSPPCRGHGRRFGSRHPRTEYPVDANGWLGRRRAAGEVNRSEQIASGRGIAPTFTVGHNADIDSLFERQADGRVIENGFGVAHRRPMCPSSASDSTRGKGRVPGLPRILKLRPVDERPEAPEWRQARSAPLSVPGHAFDQWILATSEAFAPEFSMGMDAEQTDLGRPVGTVEASHQSVGTRGPGVGLSHE